MKTKVEYTEAVDAALDRVGPLDEHEYVGLAMAALDQAGLPVAQQERVAAILRAAGLLSRTAK